MAYREQVEQLYRGGANTAGKQHFTLLYSRARDAALTFRNIKSGWSKAGLYPFRPDVVLRDIQNPPFKLKADSIINTQIDLQASSDLLPTPITTENLISLRRTVEQGSCSLDEKDRHRLQKLANAAEKAFADRALLLDENRLLFEQNNEKTTRLSMRATVVGTAKVMSYKEIVEAREKSVIKETKVPKQPQRGYKRQATAAMGDGYKRRRLEEAEKANREIEALGLSNYCSILQF
jgi:hypothetical protein